MLGSGTEQRVALVIVEELQSFELNNWQFSVAPTDATPSRLEDGAAQDDRNEFMDTGNHIRETLSESWEGSRKAARKRKTILCCLLSH